MHRRDLPATPTSRFDAFFDFDAAEREIVRGLAGPAQAVRAQRIIRAWGAPVACIYLLDQGWVSSSIELADGSRQIVKVHLPGDMMGAPSLSLEEAGETLTAITDVQLRPVPLESLTRVFVEAPRLAATFFLCAQQERVILMERVTSLGQRRAVARLAALLLHLYDRLCCVDPDQPSDFEVPLTHGQLGEILGLTSVHIQRVFKQLQDEGWIRREGRRIELADIPGLRRFCEMPERRWVRNPGWVAAMSVRAELTPAG